VGDLKVSEELEVKRKPRTVKEDIQGEDQVSHKYNL
jgi:hypothetical protein